MKNIQKIIEKKYELIKNRFVLINGFIQQRSQATEKKNWLLFWHIVERDLVTARNWCVRANHTAVTWAYTAALRIYHRCWASQGRGKKVIRMIHPWAVISPWTEVGGFFSFFWGRLGWCMASTVETISSFPCAWHSLTQLHALQRIHLAI